MRTAASHVRSRRRPSSDADSIPLSTTKATAGTSGWRTRLHTQTEDGAQGWCGPGVCVFGEEPKAGRNETVWVLMRNCLHKCNRTQVRPAANEEAEGIETVASLLPELTEAVREGRTRRFADITDEGDPENDEETVIESDVMDVRLGRPDSQPEPESNVLADPDANPGSTRSETHPEPEAEVSTSIGTDMEIGARDHRVRTREENNDSPRHNPDASTDRESTAEPREKVQRRAGTSEHGTPSRPAEASSSEPSQTSAVAASDTLTGERRYVSMTEEGPSGNCRTTIQRDHGGRWIPTKEAGTMTFEKAREARRNFYVGGKQGIRNLFDRVSRSESPVSQSTKRRRSVVEPSFLPMSKRSFRKRSKWSGKGCSTSRR